MCGEATGGAEYPAHPKLFISNLALENIGDIFKSAVCVDKCPTAKTTAINCIPSGSVSSCADLKPYATTTILTYCFPVVSDPSFPEDFKTGWKLAMDQFKSSQPGSSLEDLYLSSTAIFASIGMGVVYSFIFIYIMSLFAEYIAWFCIALTQLGLIAGAVGCWLLREDEKTTYDKAVKIADEEDDAA